MTRMSYLYEAKSEIGSKKITNMIRRFEVRYHEMYIAMYLVAYKFGHDEFFG